MASASGDGTHPLAENGKACSVEPGGPGGRGSSSTRRSSLHFCRKEFLPESRLRKMKSRKEMKLELKPEE